MLRCTVCLFTRRGEARGVVTWSGLMWRPSRPYSRLRFIPRSLCRHCSGFGILPFSSSMQKILQIMYIVVYAKCFGQPSISHKKVSYHIVIMSLALNAALSLFSRNLNTSSHARACHLDHHAHPATQTYPSRSGPSVGALAGVAARVG